MIDLSALNPQQRQAVETVRGPVLILAGAGTGKTRVITYRVAHLLERGVAPENVLGVTFTNKAAREMQERIRKLIPKDKHAYKSVAGAQNGKAQPTICTFHSLCVRILREHIEKLGYKRNFVIYDESEQLGAIKKILSHISLPRAGEKVDPADLLALLSRLKNGGERAAVFAKDHVRAMAEHIQSKYESALRACNAVDFDDLILLTLRLFQEHPAALEACRAKYRYVMVDEYQDTNAAQFKLVHALTREHRNLCVVGDDDQSIYGWRGAEIANLLDMEQHYPEVKVIKLEQNYRSTNTILSAANALISRNVRRRGKKLWSHKGEGPKITLHTFRDDEEEARGIVDKIEFARLSRRVPWSDQAILFRTNVQSRPLETALRQSGVRYHLIGGQSFFDRREVRDFLAYLKLFLNPHDDVSLLRIANVPARGLSETTMERLLAGSHERKCSVFAVMKNPAFVATLPSLARDAIARFVEFTERTRGALHAPANGTLPNSGAHAAAVPKPGPAGFLHNWADRFLDEIAYFAELRRLEKTPEAAEGRVRNIRELMATMDSGSTNGCAGFERLEKFLEDITLDTEREEEEEPGNAVTLITTHSCKGLEFPHVYIVGLEEGLLPHARSKEEETLDEERRLFYVAITRAMQTLTISHCASRKKYGQLHPCHASRFLAELPKELVELANDRNQKPVPAAAAKSMFDVIRAATD